MKVIEFLKRYIYNTHSSSLVNFLLEEQAVLGTLDSALQLLNTNTNGSIRSWQIRVIEAQNPGGNVLKFKTNHPILSGTAKFYYGKEEIEPRFKEQECICEVDTDPKTTDCKCWNVCGYGDAKQIVIKEISPGAPLLPNTYKIYGGYAGGGHLGDKVEMKFCLNGSNCCTKPGESLYMEYAMGPVVLQTIHDNIPLPPAYLVPLSLFFKYLIAPGGENRLAGQEQTYYQAAVQMIKDLDARDRTLNAKSITHK